MFNLVDGQLAEHHRAEIKEAEIGLTEYLNRAWLPS